VTFGIKAKTEILSCGRGREAINSQGRESVGNLKEKTLGVLNGKVQVLRPENLQKRTGVFFGKRRKKTWKRRNGVCARRNVNKTNSLW